MEKVEKIGENKKNKYIILLFFAISCVAFAIPSIIYYFKYHTVLKYPYEFQFLLDNVNRHWQTYLYIAILACMVILYFFIVKNRKVIFQRAKPMFIYLAIIAIIFMIVIPFTSSDVFYYLGVGRIDGTYEQNPYYTTIKDFVSAENNKQYLQNDTVLEQGYNNYWSNTTVVYGPVWTLICKAVRSLIIWQFRYRIICF